jgi:hypothetical protein
MQIYALRGYFTDLRMGRQPNLETKEECHELLMIEFQIERDFVFDTFSESFEKYSSDVYTIESSKIAFLSDHRIKLCYVNEKKSLSG